MKKMAVEFRWIWLWHITESHGSKDTGVFAVAQVWFPTYQEAVYDANVSLENYPWSGLRLCIETRM